MEQNELVVFKIISAVGSARYSYIEAIQEAKRVTLNKQDN